MAEARGRSERGPFLSAAFFCEKILEEKDGVKSAIRIVDRITQTAVGPKPPKEMQPFDYKITLFIRFKSGWARGSFTLKIEIVKPSGESSAPAERTIFIEGEEDRGIDISTNMRIKLDMTGIYWFHIYLEDEHLTQVPLRVIYMPQIIQERKPPRESSEPDDEPPTQF